MSRVPAKTEKNLNDELPIRFRRGGVAPLILGIKLQMKTIQQEFAENVREIVRNDASIIALAVAGSWLTGEIDEFSDLDLILVTHEKIGGDRERMLDYAKKFGKLLNGFTGEHVGEPRVLICLYDEPLLHVDIKFITPDEFSNRLETPAILFDTNDVLKNSLPSPPKKFPFPGYQWIEDRFWIWIHYALLKIGRGELFEALDFLGFLRMTVFGPLLHIKNSSLPRGVRRVETQLAPADLERLKMVLAEYDPRSLVAALENGIIIYKELRNELFDREIVRWTATESRVELYLEEIKQSLNAKS